MRVLLHLRLHALRQREMPGRRICLRAVGYADADLFQIFRSEHMSVRVYVIVELQPLSLRLLNPVCILYSVSAAVCTLRPNDIVGYTQAVSRFAHAAFDVVLAPIDRTCHNLAEHVLARSHQLLAVVMLQRVVVRILHLRAYRVACRKVKHHDVAFLRTRPAFESLVLPMRPI